MLGSVDLRDWVFDSDDALRASLRLCPQIRALARAPANLTTALASLVGLDGEAMGLAQQFAAGELLENAEIALLADALDVGHSRDAF